MQNTNNLNIQNIQDVVNEASVGISGLQNHTGLVLLEVAIGDGELFEGRSDTQGMLSRRSRMLPPPTNANSSSQTARILKSMAFPFGVSLTTMGVGLITCEVANSIVKDKNECKQTSAIMISAICFSAMAIKMACKTFSSRRVGNFVDPDAPPQIMLDSNDAEVSSTPITHEMLPELHVSRSTPTRATLPPTTLNSIARSNHLEPVLERAK